METKFRTKEPPSNKDQLRTVKPAAGFASCAVVHKATSDAAQIVLRLQVFVTEGHEAHIMAHSPYGQDWWVVDSSETTFDRDAVREALIAGAPGLPPGPPPWG
jgi:hypothetical protein